MLLKSHEIPLSLLKLAALKRRVSPGHPRYQKIVNDWSIYHSGYRGELALDYYLQRFNGPKNYILHNVRLSQKQPFQMDTLILSPYFFLIIEVKNIIGSVNFDHHFGQMTRMVNGQAQSFQDPIIQVENQAHHFKNWLTQHNISPVPIETLVVFVSKQVQLTRSDQHGVDPRIIHANKLADAYENLNEQHSKNFLDQTTLQKISKQMVQENRPLDPNVFDKYQIEPHDIQPGVFCPDCNASPMKRQQGYWKCEACSHSSRTAHMDALKDFQLLFGDHIKNREARWMLQIRSRKVARQLLKGADLELLGKNKGAAYLLNFDYKNVIQMFEFA